MSASDVLGGRASSQLLSHYVAATVQDPVHEAMLQMDHIVRVLDRENTGFFLLTELLFCLHQAKHWDKRGVTEVIELFLRSDIRVVVVTILGWMVLAICLEVYS